jgi:[ribosomal protein S18]-alanine N-acetyltransferase
MSMHLNYTPMRAADLETVIKIEADSFGGYWSRRIFEEEIKQPYYRLWSLRHEKQVLGYSGMWRVLEESHLTTLAIAPAWRGKKLGELLLWLVLERCLREEAHWTTLEVRPSNKAAITLYRKYGLVQIGERKHYYPDNEDALVLWRPDLQTPSFQKLLTQRGDALLKRLGAAGITVAGKTRLP